MLGSRPTRWGTGSPRHAKDAWPEEMPARVAEHALSHLFCECASRG